MIEAPPKLDERLFQQLLDAAIKRIRQDCPQWIDLSPNDPGMVAVEAFAYLTELMLHRLNRLPEKAYVEFLRLIGVRLQPPHAASAVLRFSLPVPAERAIDIPRGTRVTAARVQGSASPPTFSTVHDATIAPGETEAFVRACHGQLVRVELAGVGTGLPGQHVRVARPPIVAPIADNLDLIVAVEAGEGELEPGERAVVFGQRTYRIWREVETFADVSPDDPVYMADRLAGLVMFAPALREWTGPGLAEQPRALALAPAEGREIRITYLSGGGPEGNVAAGVLTVMRDPAAGLQVTNADPAMGGRAGESLANAMMRGPKELHSLKRPVTAQDYELVAWTTSGAIDRAKAFTEAMLWTHGRPGTVLLLLVPHVPQAARDGGRVGSEQLLAHQSEDARRRIEVDLEARRPLGTLCRVQWALCKPVIVTVRCVVAREEDALAVRDRVLARLYQKINPCAPPAGGSGWRFGEALRTWHVYELIRPEKGVQYVDFISLGVESAPDKNVSALAMDAFQPRTCYGATEHRLFRTSNRGDGWELLGTFEDETISVVRCSTRESGSGPRRAGLVCLATTLPDGGSRVHVTEDCGETWRMAAQTEFRVEDAAWLFRDGEPVLLLATDVGLYELVLRAGGVPVQILVDPKNQGLGFYAVAISTDYAGITRVAVAAMGNKGVWLSHEGGRRETFRPVGLNGEMVRRLAVQHAGPHAYLWVGLFEAGEGAGKGCFRFRLTASPEAGVGWEPFGKNWRGGSCRALAFLGNTVIAGTRLAGVTWLDSSHSNPEWQIPDIGCGLPLRSASGLHSVDAIAASVEDGIVLAAGIEGIYRASNPAARYQNCSQRTFEDRITIPPTWLFCSGHHRVEVVSEDEASRD